MDDDVDISRALFERSNCSRLKHLSGSSEVWLGELPVSVRLVIGSERLRLLFTNSRILVVHGGKSGSGPGAVMGTGLLGQLGTALESVFRGGRGRSKENLKNTPSHVLGSHKDNFPIDYSEVVNVNVTQTSMLTSITLLTSGDKFEFSCRSRFEEIVRLFNNTLAEKLTVQRIG